MSVRKILKTHVEIDERLVRKARLMQFKVMAFISKNAQGSKEYTPENKKKYLRVVDLVESDLSVAQHIFDCAYKCGFEDGAKALRKKLNGQRITEDK